MTLILTRVPSGSTREDQHTAYNTDTLLGQKLYWYYRMGEYNVTTVLACPGELADRRHGQESGFRVIQRKLLL